MAPSRSIASGDVAKGTRAEGRRSMRHAKSLRRPPLGTLSRSRRFRHKAASPPGHGRDASRTLARPFRMHREGRVCVINKDYLSGGELLAAVSGIA
jgi:hypothetical protein